MANKAILVGNVGQDPEIRYTGDNKAIANISLATSERWKDKSGEMQEKTEWHKVVVFGKLAEVVEKYVKKGNKLYLEGKIQTRKWEDKDGNDRWSTEIVLDFNGKMEMLSSKGEVSDTTPPPADDKPAKSKQEAFDDDIPF